MKRLLVGLVTVMSAWATLYGAPAGKVLDMGGTSGTSGVQTDVCISGASFALECQVKLRSAYANGEGIFISQYPGFGRLQFGVKNGEFQTFKGDASGWISSGYRIPLNQWVHLAFTQEKEGRWRWYVNGVLQRSLCLDEVLPPALSRISIGNIPNTAGKIDFKSASLDADLADVRVWDRARTSQEIAADWNCRLTGKEPGLIGYWPLNDYSANADATEGTVKNLVDGRSCRVFLPAMGKADTDLVFAELPTPKPSSHKVRCLRFDPSVDANTVIKTSTKITTVACTMECWVNLNSYTAQDGERYFFTQYPGNGRLLMGDHNGGNWEAMKGDHTSWTGPNVKLPLNKWTHLAFTQDATGLWTWYMNGKKVGTTRSDNAPFATDNPIFLGNHSGLKHAPDARMSEARVWNYARSEEEIRANMDIRMAGTETGLIGCWPLDDANGKIRNLVTGQDETTGGTLTFEEDDDAELPFVFEGPQGALWNTLSKSFVDTDLVITATNFTLEAWTRYMGTAEDAVKELYLLSQYSGNAGRFCWGIQARKIAAFIGGEGRDGWKSSDYSITNGVWTHLAYVHDAGKKEWRFYVDGVCVKTHTGCTTNALDNVTLNLLGLDPKRNNNDRGFPGMVRDLRIWNVARSGYEISSCRTNRLSGTEFGLYAWFPMDENEAAVVEKVSGKKYSFNGVGKIRTDATTFAAPEKERPATAMAFDVAGLGTGYVPTDVSLKTANFSLETMVYWTGEGGAGEIYLATQWNQKHTENRVLLGLNAGKPFFRLGETAVMSDSPLAVNTWTHLVAVRDASADMLRLYVDGQLVKSQRANEPAPSEEGGTFTLGGFHRAESSTRSPQCVFKGYLSEFRAWSVARTAGEIRQNRYERLKDLQTLPANLTGYWPLDGEKDLRGARNLVTGVSSPAVNAWQEFDGILPMRMTTGLFIIVK